MSPPQLARNAPVINVLHPVQINLPVVFRNDRDLAALDRRNRAVGQRLDLDEPLLGEPRFNHRSAAVALAQSKSMVLLAHQKSLLLQIGQHTLARFVAIKPGVHARILVHVRVLIHHIDLR